MPRRRGKDKNPQKMSSGTQYEQQEEGKQRQSARKVEEDESQAHTHDYRQQRRTGQRSTRSAH